MVLNIPNSIFIYIFGMKNRIWCKKWWNSGMLGDTNLFIKRLGENIGFGDIGFDHVGRLNQNYQIFRCNDDFVDLHWEIKNT